MTISSLTVACTLLSLVVGKFACCLRTGTLLSRLLSPVRRNRLVENYIDLTRHADIPVVRVSKDTSATEFMKVIMPGLQLEMPLSRKFVPPSSINI
jgi:hypothetical protein